MNDRRWIRRICAGCLTVGTFLLQVEPARAEPAHGLADYALTNWAEEDGPFPFGVLAIAQDRDGYLWLGARTGLIRFDGSRFELWQESEPLPAERLSSIISASDGSLWLGFGTVGAVTHLQNRHLVTYGSQDGLAGGPVGVLYEDDDGSIWVGSYNGLSHYRDGVWTRVGKDAGLPPEAVFGVLRDSRGALWVATSAGVFVRHRGEAMFAQHSPGLTRSFAEDRSGTIWITDPVVGFRALNATAKSRRVNHVSSQESTGTELLLDRSGALWVSTRGAGIMRVQEDGRIERLTRLDGLISDDVREIFEDRDGNFWVASRRGLTRLTERSVRTAQWDSGRDPFVYAVTTTRDGSIWTGTAEGLTRLKDDTEKTYGVEHGLPGRIVTALHEDRAGTLWAATTRGVARLNGDRFVPLPIGDLTLQSVRSMTSDRRGGLWLCDQDKGVFLWRDKVLTKLNRELGDRKPYFVYADSRDQIWVGFWDTGVAVMARDGVRFYSTADGVPPGGVGVIHEDRSGKIWVGTERGLGQFDGRRFRMFAASGLPEAGYVSVIEDDQGFLWLATGVGLIRISPREFDIAAADPQHRIQYTVYGRDDGLNGLAGRPGMPNSARANDGGLWFVTSVGLAVVQPARLRETPAPGPVRIEAFAANGQPFDISGDLSLPPRTSRIEIDYSILSLAGPAKSRFRYRLDGFDAAWKDAGERRQAVYTNLPPGTYTFRVTSNHDSVNGGTSAALTFGIAPAFYQRRLFYAMTAGSLVVGLWVSWRLHLRHVRQQFNLVLAERVRVGREIHDTLLQSLVGVALEFDDISEQLEPHAAALKQQVSDIRDRVEHYIREARQSIWNLRSPTLEATDLATAVRQFGEIATMHHGIEFRFVTTGPARRLDEDLEEQLLRIGQEAITNAVRHGQPGTIRVELRYSADTVMLNVNDDGHGFDVGAVDARETGEHWGVATMRERAKQIGARFSVQSRPGVGTTVEAAAPLLGDVVPG